MEIFPNFHLFTHRVSPCEKEKYIFQQNYNEKLVRP